MNKNLLNSFNLELNRVKAVYSFLVKSMNISGLFNLELMKQTTINKNNIEIIVEL